MRAPGGAGRGRPGWGPEPRRLGSGGGLQGAVLQEHFVPGTYKGAFLPRSKLAIALVCSRFDLEHVDRCMSCLEAVRFAALWCVLAAFGSSCSPLTTPGPYTCHAITILYQYILDHISS